ncbi:MAG: FtsX-like permease family protein [Ruminiclostridium sp.]|nr:FtsX-like permease family protein [Ruminiclostridium sp.]
MALILIIEGFALGMYSQTASFVNKNGADLYITQKGSQSLSDSFISRSLESLVSDVDGVGKVTSVNVIPIIFDVGKRKTTMALYGFQRNSGMGGPWKLTTGRMIAGNDEIIVDSVMAGQNGLQAGKKVQLLGKEFQIVGLSSETNSYMNSSIFVTQAAIAGLLNNSGLVSAILIKAGNTIQVNALKEILARKFPDLQVLTRSEMAGKISSTLEDAIGPVISIIVGVAFPVGIMVVGLTMYIMVLGKSKEYGILKAIGTDNKKLYTTVLGETVFLTVLGFVAGFLLFRLSAWLIMQIWPQFYINADSASFIKAVIMTIAMSMLSTITPIRRISKIDTARVFNS